MQFCHVCPWFCMSCWAGHVGPRFGVANTRVMWQATPKLRQSQDKLRWSFGHSVDKLRQSQDKHAGLRRGWAAWALPIKHGLNWAAWALPIKHALGGEATVFPGRSHGKGLGIMSMHVRRTMAKLVHAMHGFAEVWAKPNSIPA